MLKTYQYLSCPSVEIVVGNQYYLGQLADSDGELEELLDSGIIYLYDYQESEFKRVVLDLSNLDDYPQEPFRFAQSQFRRFLDGIVTVLAITY